MNIIVVPKNNIDGGFSTMATSNVKGSSSDKGLPAGAIAGIVAGSMLVLL